MKREEVPEALVRERGKVEGDSQVLVLGQQGV